MATPTAAAVASGEDGDSPADEATASPEPATEGDEPLTYYVDPSVPPEWREYMRAGVEAWRPAFEAAGLGGEAIRAVLPDDEAWPSDYDPGDIRCR